MTLVPLDSPKGKQLLSELSETLRRASEMKGKDEPTPTAVRAAELIRTAFCVHTGNSYVCDRCAGEVIDHETGLPELIAALQPFAAIEECGYGLQIGDGAGYDHSGECAECRQVLAARAAIGKAEDR